MSALPRLRQVVAITADLESAAAQLQDRLGLGEPYIDPGVAEFGLENRVFAAGDCFIELLTPMRSGSAGGRHLERKGGDAGYMALFQVDDREGPRRRAAELDIRVVWQADLADISGTHLHPADLGATIVSIDWADPPASWRWGGPAWTGGAPDHETGGITSLTVASVEPEVTAARWATVIGPGADAAGATVHLADAGQQVRFVPAASRADEGITGWGLALPDRSTELEIAGVTITVEPI